MSGLLQDKVAIVTGGASGLGEATVRKFIDEGAKVAIFDVNEEDGKALVKELTDAGAEVIFVKTNIADETAVKNGVAKTVDKFGRVDVLVNNAGVGNGGKVADVSLEDWRKTLSVDVDGGFLMTKHVIKQMLKNGGGAIVNMASGLGYVARPELSSYVTSKHAMIGLTQATALDYATDNIRVNAVCPGYVNTHIIDYMTTEEKENLKALHPMGRLGEPEEIADAVVFLASDKSSFMTGSSLIVDGGYTAQ